MTVGKNKYKKNNCALSWLFIKTDLHSYFNGMNLLYKSVSEYHMFGRNDSVKKNVEHLLAEVNLNNSCF